jgi:hypothetical protein
MADTKAQIVISAVDRTKAGFDTARRNIAGLQTGAQGLLGTINPIIGSVGLLGSALSALSFKSIVDGLDALNDIKDATGASIENISALEDVAARTGTSIETVSSALTKFNRDLQQAKPGSEIAKTLKAIGLNAEELKRLDPAEALLETSKALAGFADDGNKARGIQNLFGKSVREVAPFLKDLAEQGKLNATVTTKQAEEAEKFNKQVFELQKNLKDLGRSVFAPAIEGVNAVGKAAAGGAVGFDQLSDAAQVVVVPLQALTVLGANVSFVLKGLGREIGAIAAQASALLKLDFSAISSIRAEVLFDGERARAELDAFEKTVLGLSDRPAPAVGVGVPSEPDGRLSLGGTGGESEAAKAAEQALANLRKLVDGNVKAIGASLSDVQDELRFGEQFSRTLYSQGLQSLERFYADQEAARQDNLAALRQAAADEIAERQRLLDSPLLRGPEKAGDRQEVLNQIAEARAKLAAAEREADQAARLGVVERERALEALREQVDGLDAQIRDLSTGGTLESDLLDIAERVRAAQRLFVQGGDSDAAAAQRAQQLGQALELQRQFNVARAGFSSITQDAAMAEERLLLAAEAGGAGLLETEDRVRELRTASLAQLQELIAATRELATANPQNAPLLQFLQDLELQAERARAVLDPRKLRLDAAAGDGARALTDGLRAAARQGADLRSIINDVGQRLNDIVLDAVIFQPFEQGLKNILTGAGGQGFGENSIGKLFGLNSGGLTVPGFAGGQIGASAAVAAADAGLAAVGTAATAVAAPALTSMAAAASGVVLPAFSGVGAAATTTAPALAALAVSAGAASTALALISANQVGDAGGDALGAFIAAAGFDSGGYTGNAGTKQAAGVVHGQEFVFSAPAVKRLGIDSLEQLHESARQGARLRGFARGGYVGVQPRLDQSRTQPADSPSLSVVNHFTISGPVDRRTENQIATAAARAMRMALARGTA